MGILPTDAKDIAGIIILMVLSFIVGALWCFHNMQKVNIGEDGQ